MKKILIFLVCTMIFCATVLNCYAEVEKTYFDINGHWAKGVIEKWSSYNLVGGYSDGSFKPNKNITRAEAVKIINSIIGEKNAKGENFSDVSPDKWYFMDMLKAKTNGYYQGFKDSVSKADTYITRQDVAVLLGRTIVLQSAVISSSYPEPFFKDKDKISSYAQQQVYTLCSMGVFNGYEDQTLKPTAFVTRAELLKMVDLIMEKNDKTSEKYGIFWENINGVSSKKDSVNWKNINYKDSYSDINYPRIYGHPDKLVEDKINKKILEEIGVSKGSKENGSIWSAYEVTYNKNKLLSIIFTMSSYIEGAAHPSHAWQAYTFDLETGNVLSLDDHFKSGYDYLSIMKTVADSYLSGLDIPMIRPYEGVKNKNEYYLTDTGFELFYQEYDYTPYVYGSLKIPIPYTSFDASSLTHIK